MEITRHKPKPTPPPVSDYVIRLTSVEMVALRADLSRFLSLGYTLKDCNRDLYEALLSPDTMKVVED